MIASQDEQFISERITNHREYISRQWQYFAAFILLNGILLNAIKELSKEEDRVFLLVVSVASVITAGVFLHLVNWTRMRIYRNAHYLHSVVGRRIIEVPTKFEGIAPALLVSITAFTAAWIVRIYQMTPTVARITAAAYIAIAVYSFASTLRWARKPLLLEPGPRQSKSLKQ